MDSQVALLTPRAYVRHVLLALQGQAKSFGRSHENRWRRLCIGGRLEAGGSFNLGVGRLLLFSVMLCVSAPGAS